MADVLTNDEQGFLEGLVGASGTDDADANPNPESNPNPDDQGTNPDDQGEGSEGSGEGTNNDGGDEGSIDDLLDGNQDKSNKAFAQLRVENKQQKQLINNIATALGLNPKAVSEAELTKQLNSILTQQQAEAQKVPAELLERLSSLEQLNESYRQDQLRGQARAGLNYLKTKYEATQDELLTFINSLEESGLNPLTDPIDFEGEYLKRNMDSIIAKKVEAAVKQETERRDKVDEHASTPNGAQGNSKQGESHKINTVAELTRFLNSQAE